ncbi:putative silencing supressor [Mint virus 1]|uniref:Putative silencing supressor n=1 Tax=Mint virus 1 TaxID=300740 RepID=Q5G7F9_9CLOS|nr:putative silencing supressor [Mint virus 1]AAW32899.1 putative silencing supressor [Mint virus 1]
MKLYFRVAYYESLVTEATNLLTRVRNRDENHDRAALNKWILDFTDLAARVQCIKSDVNDAKREESAHDINTKVALLQTFEQRLAEARDVLRLIVVKDQLNLESKELLAFFVKYFTNITPTSFDHAIEYSVRQLVSAVLLHLSSESGLDISANTFRQNVLLRSNNKVIVEWTRRLGYTKEQLADMCS